MKKYNNILLTKIRNEVKSDISFLKIKKVLNNLKADFCNRELDILWNLSEVKQNIEVPEGYFILEFYANNGEGFEAGLTPNGYSITN